MKENTPQEKEKNEVYFLSGSSDVVIANSQGFKKSITLANSRSSRARMLGFLIKYKAGLENCAIDIRANSIDKNGKLFEGTTQVGLIGSEFGSSENRFFPIPGKKPILSGNDQFEIFFWTKAIAIADGDVCLSLMLEDLAD